MFAIAARALILFGLSFSIHSSADVPTAAQKAATEGTTQLEQTLGEQPGRLSLFLYSQVLSLYIERYPTRAPTFERFLDVWNRSLDILSENKSASSTAQILTELLARPEFDIVKVVLQGHFDQRTMIGISLYRVLDGYAPSSKRILQALKATHHLAASSQARPAAVSVANAFAASNDPLIRSEAQLILKECAKGFEVDGKFDLLSLENFVGGAGLKLAIRLPWLKASLNYVKNLSVFSKAIVGSVGAHAVALNQIMTPDDRKAEEKLKSTPSALAKKVAVAKVAPEDKLEELLNPKSTHIVAPDAFVARIESLLQSWTARQSEISEQMAEIFFTGELIEHFEGRVDLGDRRVQKLLDFRRIREQRERLNKKFDDYMKDRGLSHMDAKAMADLRKFMTPMVPVYQLTKQYWLPTLLGARGNCVSRALLFLAYYYPIYLKYKPDDVDFGIQLYSDHVEAVLYNSKSEVAIALMSLQPVARSKMSDILHPEVVLATYLARRSNLQVPTKEMMTLCKIGEPCKGFKVGMKAYLKRSFGETKASVPNEMRKIDDDVNPSPFFSRFYADPMQYSNDGTATEDDFNALNPQNDLKDFTLGKDIAPKVEGQKPPSPSNAILNQIVTVTNVQTSTLIPVFNGDAGGYVVAPPSRIEDEDAGEIEHILVPASIRELFNVDLNRKTVFLESMRSRETGTRKGRSGGAAMEALRRLIDRKPQGESQSYSGVHIDPSIFNLPQNLAPVVRPASKIWKSPVDFAKYVSTISCEFVDSVKMRRIAGLDTAAFESLSINEIAGFRNLYSLIHEHNISTRKEFEEVQIHNFIKDSVETCGALELIRSVEKLADQRFEKLNKDSTLSIFKKMLEDFNQMPLAEVRRQVALFLLSVDYTEVTSVLDKPRLVQVIIARLQIDLNRNIVEKPKSEAAARKGEVVSVPIITTAVPMQIRLIPTSGSSEAQAKTDANAKVSLQLRPEVFFELILTDSPWFFDKSAWTALERPLSQLNVTDYDRIYSRKRLNVIDEKIKKDPLLQKWLQIATAASQSAATMNGVFVGNSSSGAAANILKALSSAEPKSK